MTQRFTKAEEDGIRPIYSKAEVQSQVGHLRSLALRAWRAENLQQVIAVRTELLGFRESLGPDDDTYDVLVDSTVDSLGLDLLTYCNQRLAGRREYAETFMERLLPGKDGVSAQDIDGATE